VKRPASSEFSTNSLTTEGGTLNDLTRGDLVSDERGEGA